MKLPVLSSKETLQILEKLGFKAIRQKGSHVFMRHDIGRNTVVPLHPGRDIGRGLLRKIINEIEISRDEFIHFVNENK